MGYYLSGLRSFTVDFLSYPNFIGKMPHQVLNSTGEIHTRATHCYVDEKPSFWWVGDLCFIIEKNIVRELSWCPSVIYYVCSHLKVSIDYSLYAITWGSDNPEECKELQATLGRC